MGFLKFLKKEKKQDSLDELDLPPAPPPLSGFDDKMQDFSELPKLDAESLPDMEKLPDFEAPQEEQIPEPNKEDFMHDFDFSNMEAEHIPIPPVTADAGHDDMQQMPEHLEEHEQVAEEAADQSSQDFESRIEKKIFSEEKKVLGERPDLKTVYVKVERFKATLGNINVVRNDLKKSEEALIRLESIKNEKDKSLDRAKSLLEDLQKKLIFIDKSLFKGE